MGLPKKVEEAIARHEGRSVTSCDPTVLFHDVDLLIGYIKEQEQGAAIANGKVHAAAAAKREAVTKKATLVQSPKQAEG